MLAMELALRLGRTVDELIHSMSALEFDLWCEYRNQSPWDASRADLNTGLVCATIANYAGMQRKEGSEPAAPSTFMPFLRSHDIGVAADVEPDPEAFFSQFK